MPIQTYPSMFETLGSAQYVGANAVVKLTDAPTNSGGFGKTITQIETTLNTGSMPGLPGRVVKNLVFSIEGGAAHVLTGGNIPTAAIGIAYADGLYAWANDPKRIHAVQFFLPVGVTLNVEYGA